MAYPDSEAHRTLDETFGVTPASNRYLALFTTAPSDTTAGTEVSGGGYARQLVAFAAAAARATSNTTAETWTAAGAAYGTVVAIGVFDALTAGNLVWWDGLDTNRTIADTDTLNVAIGAIAASFAASP